MSQAPFEIRTETAGATARADSAAFVDAFVDAFLGAIPRFMDAPRTAGV